MQNLNAESGRDFFGLSAKQLEGVMSRDRQMTHEIERKSRLLDVIVKKLDEMSLFNSQGIRIQPMAEPGLGTRTPVKRNEYMIIGGVLGFVLRNRLLERRTPRASLSHHVAPHDYGCVALRFL